MRHLAVAAAGRVRESESRAGPAGRNRRERLSGYAGRRSAVPAQKPLESAAAVVDRLNARISWNTLSRRKTVWSRGRSQGLLGVGAAAGAKRRSLRLRFARPPSEREPVPLRFPFWMALPPLLRAGRSSLRSPLRLPGTRAVAERPWKGLSRIARRARVQRLRRPSPRRKPAAVRALGRNTRLWWRRTCGVTGRPGIWRFGEKLDADVCAVRVGRFPHGEKELIGIAKEESCA